MSFKEVLVSATVGNELPNGCVAMLMAVEMNLPVDTVSHHGQPSSCPSSPLLFGVVHSRWYTYHCPSNRMPPILG